MYIKLKIYNVFIRKKKSNFTHFIELINVFNPHSKNKNKIETDMWTVKLKLDLDFGGRPESEIP